MESGGGVSYRELCTLGGLANPTLAVVRNAGSFHRLWGEVHAKYGRPPAVPRVDWTREIVVVAALGPRPNLGGYAVYLTLSEDQYGLRVLVHEKHPEPDSFWPAAVSYPTVLAAVETNADEVAFHLQEPVVGYQPTPEQQAARQSAFDRGRRTP